MSVLSAAISGYLSPAPKWSLAIDQSVSPRRTVCFTVTNGVSALGVDVAAAGNAVECPVFEVRMGWLWPPAGVGAEMTAGGVGGGVGAAAGARGARPAIWHAVECRIRGLTQGE